MAKIAKFYFSPFCSFCFSLSVCGSYHKPDFFIAVTLNGLKFDMLMYPNHFRTVLILVIICWFPSFFAPFWLSETGQICNFRTFFGERKGGMTWTLACWCILTTFWTYEILAMVCSCSSFSHHFDLVKQVKCWVSGDFLQNAWEKWLDIWHADVSWLHCQLFIIWNGLLIFLILMIFWLSETSQICRFGAFSWECIGGIGCTNLVISEEMDKTIFSILKLLRGGGGGGGGGVSLTAV